MQADKEPKGKFAPLKEAFCPRGPVAVNLNHSAAPSADANNLRRFFCKVTRASLIPATSTPVKLAAPPPRTTGQKRLLFPFAMAALLVV